MCQLSWKWKSLETCFEFLIMLIILLVLEKVTLWMCAAFLKRLLILICLFNLSYLKPHLEMIIKYSIFLDFVYLSPVFIFTNVANTECLIRKWNKICESTLKMVKHCINVICYYLNNWKSFYIGSDHGLLVRTQWKRIFTTNAWVEAPEANEDQVFLTWCPAPPVTGFKELLQINLN